jgi:uncharacterized membrane protein YidH (DUF202 family)
MLQSIAAILHWLLNLFDPPPLKSMTFAQKVGRVVLLSGTLVIGSVLVAMLGALGLYLMERGRELRDTPEFYKGIVIILTGIVVNTFCVLILVQIKRVDHKLIPPTRSPVEPIVHLKITPEQLSGPKEKPKPTD